MPVPGRKPKPDGQKRNHVKPTYDWVEVPDVPYTGRKPVLPRREVWPAQTRAWWKAVSSMPHCVLWGPADWAYALTTAELHARFFCGESKVAPELRQREKVLGTTVDARRDIRVRYVDPTPVAPAGNVTRLDRWQSVVG